MDFIIKFIVSISFLTIGLGILLYAITLIPTTLLGTIFLIIFGIIFVVFGSITFSSL